MSSQPAAPKLPRRGTIRRHLVDFITQAEPGAEFSWSQLKGVYDEMAHGSPDYTQMEVARLLRRWTTRIRRGVYAPKWLMCGCNAELLSTREPMTLHYLDADGVMHTWDNCASIPEDHLEHSAHPPCSTCKLDDPDPDTCDGCIGITEGMAANGSADGNPWLEEVKDCVCPGAGNDYHRIDCPIYGDKDFEITVDDREYMKKLYDLRDDAFALLFSVEDNINEIDALILQLGGR